MGRLGNFGEIKNSENTNMTETEPSLPANVDKRKLQLSGNTNSRYEMNTPATIDYHLAQGTLSKDAINSAVGGKDGHKGKLRGAGREYFLSSDSDPAHKPSGRYLAEDNPGNSAKERQENLQTPKYNDCGSVNKVQSTRPTFVLESRIAKQPNFAKDCGYEARDGMKQIITPSKNPKGPIADGTYKIVEDNKQDKC